MRFAITACDNSLGVFEGFIKAGWEPLKLFGVPSPSGVDSNFKVIELAQSKHINVQLSRMTESDLKSLSDNGCEALVVADYKWRIGDWRPYLQYAVNFHPSPLPEARGPYPMVRALLESRKSWGVSCHRLDPDFDTGDILAADMFKLDDTDSLESLNLKIQMAFIRLTDGVANNFIELWNQALPQGTGSYWPNPTQEDQKINFSNSVPVIMRQLRAFGEMGCLACVNGIWIYIRRAVGWEESHDHQDGAVAHVNNKTLVVTARDGYIGILEWSLASSDIAKVLMT